MVKWAFSEKFLAFSHEQQVTELLDFIGLLERKIELLEEIVAIYEEEDEPNWLQ